MWDAAALMTALLGRPAAQLGVSAASSQQLACDQQLLGTAAARERAPLFLGTARTRELTCMPRMKGTGASSRCSMLSCAGSTGMSMLCQAKGRSMGIMAKTAVVSSPILGLKNTSCRSSKAPAGRTAVSVMHPQAKSTPHHLRHGLCMAGAAVLSKLLRHTSGPLQTLDG